MKLSFFPSCRLRLLFLLLAAAGLVAAPAPAAEYVDIDEARYEVPAPWAGNRLVAEDRVPEDIAPVPVEWGENGMQIYLRRETRDALVKMLSAAAEDGHEIRVRSGYRSVRYQKQLYRKRFAAGRTFDDIVAHVAPPGYSQHHLGTAVDLSVAGGDFGNSDAYRWLLEHAGQYCFAETYPKHGAGSGVRWEPWHWNHACPGGS